MPYPRCDSPEISSRTTLFGAQKTVCVTKDEIKHCRCVHITTNDRRLHHGFPTYDMFVVLEAKFGYYAISGYY